MKQEEVFGASKKNDAVGGFKVKAQVVTDKSVLFMFPLKKSKNDSTCSALFEGNRLYSAEI